VAEPANLFCLRNMSSPYVAMNTDGRDIGRKLSAALAVRISHILPQGIVAKDEKGTIYVSDGTWHSGTDLAEVLGSSGPSLPDPEVIPRGISLSKDMPTPAEAENRPARTFSDAAELREDIASAATNALSAVQDFVTEKLTLPWPSHGDAASRSAFAEPNAEWFGDVLRLWFGEKSQPVLELQPIEATELNESLRS